MTAMKLVILDRDGTINADSDEFIKSADEWVPLPGALEAIARLSHAGFHVVVACDQSGLGRGLFDVASMNAIHSKMHKALAAVGGRVDAVFYCPHGPEESCLCRLPQTGLFDQIAQRHGLGLSGIPVCSSTPLHLQAGAAAGCEPHWVRGDEAAGSAEGAQPPAGYPPASHVHTDLAAFADWLIERDAQAAAALAVAAGAR